MRALGGLLAVLVALTVLPASAMSLKVVGDQIVMSGDVDDDDHRDLLAALRANPSVNSIVLRNSSGGNAETGYRIGEMIRERGLRTVLSGYCWSSCSRMFLGGKTRVFSSDYPLEYTHVSFHGHYNRGLIDLGSVNRLGLRDWIIKYSDGKADPNLVARWISIPRSGGAMHFFHPSLVALRGKATYLCDGNEGGKVRMFGCEPIGKTALDLGIVTSLDVVAPNDQAELRQTMPALPPIKPGVAAGDMAAFPLKSEAAQREYERFLGAAAPRVFAKQIGGGQYAWNANKNLASAVKTALERCVERAKGQPCAVYALDDHLLEAP